MSLEDVRQVSAQHPTLLPINLGSTCYEHTVYLIDWLRRKGHLAYHVCKSPGESQYIPPDFAPRDVIGLDGRIYRCSGVSPDAIWCDGKIVDTIAQCNDTETPIGMPGLPVWNEIAPEFWRANNPPLKDGAPIPPPPSKILPKGEAFAALTALNAFYQAPEGLQRPGGLVRFDSEGRSVADMEAIAQWFYQLVIEGMTLEQVFTQIRASDEWRSKHGQ